jgi:hypothetical protein
MSLKKYIELKKESITKVLIENYKKELNKELILLTKNFDSTRIQELKETLIDELKLSKLLQEIKYPYLEELKIIVQTGDPQKIEKERKKISVFERSEPVVSLLLFYESFFYSNNIPLKEIDKIIESYCDRTNIIALDLAHKIDLAKEKIQWRNHETQLEALYPKKRFLAHEFLLKVGNNFNKKFIINLNSNEIKHVETEEDIPSSLKEDSINLIEKIFDTSKNFGILYMNCSKNDRRKFEQVRKELSLGIKHFLPFSLTLSEAIDPIEGFDIWEIKTDLNKLKKIDNKYLVYEDDTPLKWMRLL